MKAERRHELQQNALADWLANAIEQVKPHAGVILTVVGGLLLLLLGWVYLANQRGSHKGPDWDAYYQAAQEEGFEQRVKELTSVAEDNPGTPAGLWARLTAADSRLLEGTNKSFKDRLAGEEEISKAMDDFKAVLEGAAKLPAAKGELLKSRAMWGLALAHESLAEGEEAIKQYEAIAKASPDSALGKASKARAKRLAEMDTWLAWYDGVDPKSIKPTERDRQPPLDFTPPRQPQPYDDLPDDPDLTLPGPLDLDPTRGGGLLRDPPGASDTPATETPESETPATETPSTDAPATEEPATETPPAEGEAPASDAPASDAPAETPEAEAPAAPETPAPEAPAEPAPPADETSSEGGN